MARAANLQPYNMVGGATLYSRGEAQRFAQEIVESEGYRESVQKRAKSGDLPAAIEALLWYYAYGKPLEQIQLTVQEEDLSQLPLQALQERARDIAQRLQEAEDLSNALPGTVVQGPWKP